VLSEKFQSLWKDVIEDEQPVPGINIFEPSTCSFQSSVLIRMRLVWVINEAEEPAKPLK
jgi:hypothetical protein